MNNVLSSKENIIKKIFKRYHCESIPIDTVPRDLIYRWHIGSPKSGKLDNLFLRGWVIGKKLPVISVELSSLNDGQLIQIIPVNIKRPDVVNAYPDFPNAEMSGFQAHMSGMTTLFESNLESYKLVIRAVLANQQRVPITILQYDLIAANTEPDFMVIGAMKAATSAIYGYLQQHPRVLRRQPKELHFFSYHFDKGMSWYLSNFAAKKEASSNQKWLIGEASPSYLNVREVPSLVKESFPNIKIIVSLRNPTERAISQYYHQVKRVGDETRTLEEAFSESEIAKAREILPSIEHDKRKLHLHKTKNGNTALYLLLGKYASQLRNWLEFFPREQILILNYHDLETQPDCFVEKLFTFLDLQDHLPSKIEKIYANRYQPAPKLVRQRLDNYYRPYNQELEKFLQRDFVWS